MNFVGSISQSLKYQRFTPSDCEDIRIRKCGKNSNPLHVNCICELKPKTLRHFKVDPVFKLDETVSNQAESMWILLYSP